MFDFSSIVGKLQTVGPYAVVIGAAAILVYLVAYRLINPGRSRFEPSRVSNLQKVVDEGGWARMTTGSGQLAEMRKALGDCGFLPFKGYAENDPEILINLAEIDYMRWWTLPDGLSRMVVFLKSGREIRIEERQ